MINLSQNQKAIIKVILEFGVVSSSKVHEAILSAGQDISLITTKRILAGLMNQHYLSKEGVGRATVYKISAIGRLFADINAKVAIAYGSVLITLLLIYILLLK